MSLENLLARFFTDKASQEELEQLENWKLEAQENIDALNDIGDIWNQSDDIKDYQTFNVNKALLKVNSKIVDEELKLPSKKSNSINIKGILSIAASLALLFAAVWFIKANLNQSDQEIFSTNENISELNLSDNTIVTLDKNSSLAILNDFKKKREVEAKGRMYFDVHSDKSRPFIIETKHGRVEVLGTNFTLNTTESKTELFLFEGSVNFTYDNKVIQLSPSEAILIEDGDLLKYRFKKDNINSWKSNKLEFKDTNISDVFDALETHFNVDIETSSKLIDFTCRLSSSFNQLSLKNILKEMQLVYQMEYLISDKKIVIKKLSC